jgi:2,4-dienoyl-CoA reductase-like NADH-dependent reductase (Old Yellow Enzyme family)
VTGYAYVSKDGISPFFRQAAIDRDELVDKYRDLVDHVHDNGAKIAMQIVHCGRETVEPAIGTQPIAPSAVFNNAYEVMPREMTEEDIERIIGDFAQGARRVKEAGFDAVQIHSAHGYLLSSFISPYTNRRTDQWGGNTENRLRIVQEVYNRCRRQVGDDYPLLVKYSSYDLMENGLSPEEGITVGRMLADMGFDSIEISAGIFEDGGSTLFGNTPPPNRPAQAYHRHQAKALKSKIDVPIMLVGGNSDPAVMKEIVESGDADYITMCRALISNPSLPWKMQEGSLEPARCIHCNLCTGYCGTHPVHCYFGKKLKDEEPQLPPHMIGPDLIDPE